jgi:hypothetical protein
MTLHWRNGCIDTAFEDSRTRGRVRSRLTRDPTWWKVENNLSPRPVEGRLARIKSTYLDLHSTHIIEILNVHRNQHPQTLPSRGWPKSNTYPHTTTIKLVLSPSPPPLLTKPAPRDIHPRRSGVRETDRERRRYRRHVGLLLYFHPRN